MLDYFHISLGLILAAVGSTIWWTQERKDKFIDEWTIVAIVLILLGGLNIIYGVDNFRKIYGMFKAPDSIRHKVGLREWFFVIGLIFLGTVFYTIASYYHLKIDKWSFLAAFSIALPLVIIEYQFSLRGNHLARHLLKLNAIQITIITLIFYFINASLLNYFFLKHPTIWWRELLAFLCIILAFILTTTVKLPSSI